MEVSLEDVDQRHWRLYSKTSLTLLSAMLVAINRLVGWLRLAKAQVVLISSPGTEGRSSESSELHAGAVLEGPRVENLYLVGLDDDWQIRCNFLTQVRQY